MMASVDGRLLSNRWTELSDHYDSRVMAAQLGLTGERLHTDAWLFGTSTVKEFFPERFNGCACHKAFPDQLHTFVGDCSSKSMFIAMVPEGDVRFTDNKLRGDNIVVVTGEDVSADYLEFLEDMQISYIFAGKDGMELEKAMETLAHDFGIERIALKGGGVINGSFLRHGLIDEISVVVYPGIDGLSGVPSIFEYKPQSGEDSDMLPAQGQRLELLDAERLDAGCVWMHYSVSHD